MINGNKEKQKKRKEETCGEVGERVRKPRRERNTKQELWKEKKKKIIEAIRGKKRGMAHWKKDTTGSHAFSRLIR